MDEVERRLPPDTRSSGVYPYATRGGVRWRIAVTRPDGTVSTRRGFTTHAAAATLATGSRAPPRQTQTISFGRFWREWLAAKQPYLTEGARPPTGRRRTAESVVSQWFVGNFSDPLIPLRAMAHPLRLRMLSLLTAAPLSATELARELEIAHAAASYHIHQLADAGLVHVVETEQATGGAGRPPIRYRHDPDIDDRLDRSEGRELVFAAMVEDLGRRVSDPHVRRQFADAEVWLDIDDWETVCRLADEIVDIVHHRARAPHAPGTVHGSATTAIFELHPTEEEPDP